MYINKEQEAKMKRRKKELSSSFSKLKQNEGGSITFHFTKEIINDKGYSKRVPSHKRVVQMSKEVVHNKSVDQFVKMLQAIQHDIGADYFTF